MKLPKSIRAITDNHSEIYRKIDRFFTSIRKELIAKGIPDGPDYFKITIKNLCEPSPYARASDDMMHLLKYRERVIAIVSETRTEANFVQFDFFKNLEGLL
jgi:hypothetical protein